MAFEVIIGIIVFLIVVFLIAVIVLYFTGKIETGPVGPTGTQGPTGPTGRDGSATNTGATGPSTPSKSVITLNPGGNYHTPSAFQFFGSQFADYRSASIVINAPGTISNFYIHNEFAPGNNGSRRYDIVINGAITPLTIIMAGSQVVANNNSIVNVMPGDLVAVLYGALGQPVDTKGSMTFTITS